MSLKRIALGVGVGAAVAAYRAYKQLEQESAQNNSDDQDSVEEESHPERIEIDSQSESGSNRIQFVEEENDEREHDEEMFDEEEFKGSIVNDAIDLSLVNDVVEAVENGTVRSRMSVEQTDDFDTPTDDYAPLVEVTTSSTRVVMEVFHDDVDMNVVNEFVSYRPTGYKRVILVSEDDVDDVQEMLDEELDASITVTSVNNITEYV